MGHRTLVAYDRDGYDLHYAHWDVDPDAIAPDTPFGGPPNDGRIRERADGLLAPSGGRLTDSNDTAIDADPIATGLGFAELGSYIDPIEHEALYVVDGDFSVRTYVVFGLDGRPFGRTEPTVAVVGYEGASDAAYLRGWLAGARAVRGVCGPAEAAIIRALRWLDPDRGTVVWTAGGGGDCAGGRTDGEG
jgi:hypothetical protein